MLRRSLDVVLREGTFGRAAIRSALPLPQNEIGVKLGLPKRWGRHHCYRRATTSGKTSSAGLRNRENSGICSSEEDLNFFLDAKQESSYHAGHEQAPIGKARPNPLHAGRGLVDAFGLPRVWGLDQYRHKAAD